MPSVTYSGTFGGVSGSNGLTATLTRTSGSAIPSQATITGVRYSLKITAGGYSSSDDWNLWEIAVGGQGGRPSASADAGMQSKEHTFSGNMTFNASDVSKFAGDSITVYAQAYTTHSSSSYLWEVSITVNYELYSACGAPTACAVSSAFATGNVTLSWNGASAGYGNAITGYEVQRCESSNGSTWGNWATLATTTATSLSVAPPSTAGNYYKYRVRTLGAAGASYYSGWKESTNTLRRDHAPLGGFTDTVLTAGVTPIKAIHMQELQARVNTLRTFYGLSAFTFTTIVAGETSLAGWTAHVLEIRTAIDGIGKTHAAWIEIAENKPRADVMQQLRDVVLSI